MRLRAILYLVVMAALAGCGYTNGTNGTNDEGPGDCDSAVFEERLETLRGEIEEEIGEAKASDVAACRTLPLGAKPCGGPWTYLVYSAEASDSTRLAELAAEYHDVNAEWNEACELASDCMMVGPPDVTLENGRCVAAP
jgi:hypothetical protein